MKVLHTAWEAERYGVGTFLLNLIPYQNTHFRDLKCDMLFHSKNVTGEEKFKRMGITCHSLGAKTARDIRILLRSLRIYRDYDLINLHAHSPFAFLAAKLLKKKVIYTFHGALGLKGTLQDVFTESFVKYIFSRDCSYFTFASQASFSRYSGAFKEASLLNGKYQIFPYGIRLSKVQTNVSRSALRSQFGWDKKFVIGTALRLDPYKKIERLIEAVKLLENKIDYLLVIAGDGDKLYEQALHDLVMRYHLDDSVRFLGFRRDIYDFINAFDLFVLPSRNESFGLSLLEAMTLGIPCAVFSDGGGTVDILGDSGIIVSTAADLCTAIENLRKNAELHAELSRNVKERAQVFDISKTAEKLHAIYKHVLTQTH